MISRAEAIEILRRYISRENNLKHMISVGAIMKETASKLHQNEAEWEIIGLLHDIDFEICGNPSNHTIKAKELLREIVPESAIEVIMAHNYEHTNVSVDTIEKKALIASDAASGLIVASALVMPSKKLEEVRLETLIKKFKSRDFAKNVSRDRISLCTQFGMSIDEFLQIALDGMKRISTELGL